VAHAFWRSKVDQGRTVAALGSTEGFAFCEWSAANDTDVTDPEPWWDFHPALGFTIAPETIAADLQSMPLAEWRRAYCSRWWTTPTRQGGLSSRVTLGRLPALKAQPSCFWSEGVLIVDTTIGGSGKMVLGRWLR
jgi:hypothetical protein